jgi:uncharacterized RDD family membrane protein YckC
MNENSSPVRYAGFFSRFIAFGVDLVIVNLASFLVTVFLGWITSFFGFDTTISELGGGWSWLNTLQQLILLVGALFTTLFSLVYFLFFWVLVGFTPGKGLMGLRVVRLDGQPLTLGPAFLRFVGYWVSAAALFLGFFWIIIDKRHQGWHDKLGRTVVIYNWRTSQRQ